MYYDLVHSSLYSTGTVVVCSFQTRMSCESGVVRVVGGVVRGCAEHNMLWERHVPHTPNKHPPVDSIFNNTDWPHGTWLASRIP